ncbi:proteasome subunit beta type-7-A [Artemisia annua]|uniref:Proteasome subunit beta type-7-A n=1 Tax=Artemisia annua TaxID=35608 RepID=A0A2U1NVV1_ARTAN|nr:proteasome subunit beta type-7-A [Artemisia annua]
MAGVNISERTHPAGRQAKYVARGELANRIYTLQQSIRFWFVSTNRAAAVLSNRTSKGNHHITFVVEACKNSECTSDGFIKFLTTLAGDGSAADTEDITASQIYHTGRESRVVTALTLLKSILFRYQGHASAALVLGGVDATGPHLHILSGSGYGCQRPSFFKTENGRKQSTVARATDV